MQVAGYGEIGVRRWEIGVRSSEFGDGMQDAGFRMQDAGCGMRMSAECEVGDPCPLDDAELQRGRARMSAE